MTEIMSKKNDTVKEKKRKGISLKRMSVIVVVSTAVISLLLLIGVYMTVRSYRSLIKVSREYVTWQTKAEDMMVSSDYLTEQVRDYAETGDEIYLQNYFREANDTRRRDDALLFIEMHFPESEQYVALQNAMTESVSLMDTEYYAMRLKAESIGTDISGLPVEVRSVVLTSEDAALSVGEKDARSRRILFDEEYVNKKTQIANSTNECLAKLIVELEQRQEKAENALRVALILELVLILLFIALSAFVVFLTRRQVFKPLIRSISLIEKDSPLPLRGAYELRILADTYNQMYETNNRNKNSLKFKVNHDSLTGVKNRRAFDKVKLEANYGKVAFLILDVDNFKEVNDTCGHLVGDKMLIEVVELLRAHFRSDDSIFRIGGDEFAVVMFGMGEESMAVIAGKVDAINAALAEQKTDGVPRISISAGVAFGDLIDDKLINEADSALYERKKSGKSGCTFYKEG